MKFEGIHHISAITGDARRNVDFYTRVLGPAADRQVRQSGRSWRLPPLLRRRGGDAPAPTSPSSSTRARSPAGPAPAWSTGSCTASAPRRRSSSGPSASTTRASRSTSSTARLRFSDPEGLDHELVVDTTDDAPLVADAPGDPGRARDPRLRGRARVLASTRTGSAALLEGLMGATQATTIASSCAARKRGGWIAFDPAPAERGRQSAGTVHHIAWGTYDADLMEWIERVDERRHPELGLRRPPLLPLALLPRAGRRPVRAGDRGARLPGRRPRRSPSSAPRSSCRRSSRTGGEQIEARLTPLPDPRADWSAVTN